jgi:hypothetical protein
MFGRRQKRAERLRFNALDLGRARAGDDRVPQPLGVARRRMRDDQQALWR